MPTDVFAFNAPIRKELTKQLKEKYSEDELKYLFSSIFKIRRVQPVNSNMKDLINHLEQRNISAIALTGWWTGKHCYITEMEKFRFKYLQQVDISFINTSPFKEDMISPEFKNKDGIPMLKSEVILTASADKGLVLKTLFLKNQIYILKRLFLLMIV
ncbi:hypothetical protein ASQ44_03560 [Rickettsia rhipicephali]|uniref:DUF2608 domain-containing protein n=1 Tax=Rickettsia rhipicephali TaxID=33992 RepID=UPI00070D4472|nr:DUF2608 domain-containing protein [Rickettsia rhipicephali]ALN41214.1 hypothetical protein ASQ44_03560 [Rickettsia rhipicephali]